MGHSIETPSGDGDASRPSGLGPRLAQVLSALLGITALLAFDLFLFTGPWQILVLYRDTSAVLAFDLCLSVAFFVQHSGMTSQFVQGMVCKDRPAALPRRLLLDRRRLLSCIA